MRVETLLAIVLVLMAAEALAFVIAPEFIKRLLEEAPPGVLRIAGAAELALAGVLVILALRALA